MMLQSSAKRVSLRPRWPDLQCLHMNVSPEEEDPDEVESRIQQEYDGSGRSEKQLEHTCPDLFLTDEKRAATEGAGKK